MLGFRMDVLRIRDETTYSVRRGDAFVASGTCSAAGWARILPARCGAERATPRRRRVAVRYEHAEGVPKDFQKANALYCQAASRVTPRRNSSSAGCMPMEGVARDDGVAAALFEMAADQGHTRPPNCCNTFVSNRIRSCRPACCPIRGRAGAGELG